MNSIVIILGILLINATIHASEALISTLEGRREVKKSTFEFSGYVKLDTFLDSRQVVGFREDQYLFYPEPYLADCEGDDINAHPQFDMIPIETRLAVTAHGPCVRGAASKAYIEGDFFGTTEETINSFRMRLGYLQMDWQDARLIFGQYWHPLFVVECYPRVISYNTGAPFDNYSRDPQIQGSKFWGNHELLLAAVSQLGRKTEGPDGPSTKYIRNAIVPNLHAQYNYHGDDWNLGACIDYKRIVPRLVNDHNCIVHESNNSIILNAHYHVTLERWEHSIKVAFAQNATDVLLIPGYAVATQDPVTNDRTYTNINAFSGWYEVYATADRTFQPGLFVAYTKNLGAFKNLFIDPATGEPTVFAFHPNLDYALRISPRLRYNLSPVQFGFELEFTRAAFGKLNARAEPQNSIPVNNIRVLFAAYYFF